MAILMSLCEEVDSVAHDETPGLKGIDVMSVADQILALLTEPAEEITLC